MVASNQEWEIAAKNDALYAIASVRGKRGGKWDTDDFFAKGDVYVSYIEHAIRNVPRSAHVLDIGCGAGRISRALAKKFDHIVGVDVSPTMIQLAKELCSDVKNAEFKLGDGTQFPVASNSMDLVVSFQVLQHVAKEALPELLNNCYSTIKNGGKAVLHIPSPSLSSNIEAWTRLVPLRRLVTLIARKTFPSAKLSGRFWANTQYHTYTPERVASYLKSAGFNKIENFRWRESDPLTTVYVAER